MADRHERRFPRTSGRYGRPAGSRSRRPRPRLFHLAFLPLVALLCALGPLEARKRPPLTRVTQTAWVFSGEYRVKAKKTGLLDAYVLDFVVDFFGDGSFVLQDLPIEEGAEDDFFSGTWVQVRNKIVLTFDVFSTQLLADVFEDQFAQDPEFPETVGVFVEVWEIKSKLRQQRTGDIVMRFKERLRHVATSQGIPLRIKTKGKGTGGFLEDIE